MYRPVRLMSFLAMVFVVALANLVPSEAVATPPVPCEVVLKGYHQLMLDGNSSRRFQSDLAITTAYPLDWSPEGLAAFLRQQEKLRPWCVTGGGG